MVLPQAIIAIIALVASSASALPIDSRAINIEHTSASTGQTTVHSIDESTLAAPIAEALKSNELNIKLSVSFCSRARACILTVDCSTGDKIKRSGINNSTINLTVIDPAKKAADKRDLAMKRARTIAIVKKAKRAAEADAAAATGSHNVHIDASSDGNGNGGGIHNSTVNININHNSKKSRRATVVGQHSVLVDTSASSSSESGSAGIEDSTVHVNILPPRGEDKFIGDHSILIDSSSGSDSSTFAGDHSAVVDSSSSSTNESKGIKSSTINLTVVSPKDGAASAPAPAAKRDAIEQLRRRAPATINPKAVSV